MRTDKEREGRDLAGLASAVEQFCRRQAEIRAWLAGLPEPPTGGRASPTESPQSTRSPAAGWEGRDGGTAGTNS